MEKEISSGTMLGIVLIALAAVIGLGFGVFSIAKGVANEGVVNVQDNLGTVSESAFEDFDQKIVTGTQVQSAYKSFQGKAVAILVNTQAMNRGVTTHPDHDTAYSWELDDDIYYLNYNALLASDGEGTAGGTPVAAKSKVTDGIDRRASLDATTAGLFLKDGIVTTQMGFKLNSSGKIEFDTSIGGFTKAGNAEYINPGAKFDANLIKDASGIIVGVIFTQLAR